MKLPDFSDFPPLAALRRTMGATKLGAFEFFDPKRHLTGAERIALAGPGVSVTMANVRRLMDHTIGFKNARVLAWQPDRGEYHLCWCEKFPCSGSLVVGAGLQPDRSVCNACLDHLQYEGHNSHRHRHQAYYAEVRRQFDVAAFFDRFPHYPLRQDGS
jgi:hypothetical protein